MLKCLFLFLAAALLVEVGCQVTAQLDDVTKIGRLRTLYQAYQAHEVTGGAPAKSIGDLALAKDDSAAFERWLNLDELGLSLAHTKKEELHKMVMAYEKDAPKKGGLVLYYDGSIKLLSAEDVKSKNHRVLKLECTRAGKGRHLSSIFIRFQNG